MKVKGLVAVVVLLLSSLSSVFVAHDAAASPKAKAPAEAQLYDNLNDFKAAVAKLQSPAHSQLSESQKQARREVISAALAAVEPNDRAKLNEVAAEFALAMYDPNLNMITPLSYEQDVSVTSPTITWDSQSQEYGFRGTVTWTNLSAIESDGWWGTNIGGPDGYGLIFTSISNDLYITSTYVQQWDSLNRYTGTYYTRSFTPKSLPGPYAFTIKVQDQWKGTLNGYCNCVRSEIWAWLKPQAFGSGPVRNAYTYYAHDYKDTVLTGMELSLGGEVGPKEEKVGGSFKLVWTLATEKWAAESSPTGY